MLHYLVCFLFIGWVVSCTDHRITVVSPGSSAGRLRVKTITQETPNAPNKVSSFRYDSQGRLSLLIAYQLPDSSAAPVENTVYEYDGQNRLTQAQRTVVRRGSNSETYRYRYNAAGQISDFSHAPSTFFIIPSYTAANQVSGYNKSIGVSGLTSSGGGALTFTGNNVTFATEEFRVGRSGGPNVPVFTRSTKATYTYDDKINPFYGTFLIPAPSVFGPSPVSGSFGPYYTYYGGIDNLLNLSQNNVLSDGTRTYTYTYNSSNLPTSRITQVSGTTVETLRFEYETY
ncbi:hypothetical protein [Spirosoma fluminis]